MAAPKIKNGYIFFEIRDFTKMKRKKLNKKKINDNVVQRIYPYII
ncbi:hypothetical protein ABENE_16860 [Asticcacaulis benevestitus DSM 16100 = ATCC BAA-896]|uniref:Uncharacterized protein n=1 Tax=Asticcacaulis benevestitus DSM 16100 = ATCC BAA-896 TaxID=1121022 RepID=V4R8R1_9CAUL|nr:hypothetical protein ABENE_16860 [Asticcacaulis benevestitus DSM 16100 = ATCC BAA-896]